MEQKEEKQEEAKQEEKKQDKRIYIMSREKPAKAVIKLGVPLIAGMFIMVLYNLVDTYFIGLMKDDYQLAAVNLAYPVMMVMVALSNVIGTGGSSLIARSLGAKEKEKAEHTLAVSILLMLINAVVTMLAGLILLPFIVKWLGAQSNTVDYTRQYVEILFWGTIFTMGSYTFGALLRGEGSVKLSIAGMIAGTLANMILDPVFIFGLRMGIRGAAIATVLGNAISTLISLGYYLRGKALLKPVFSGQIKTRGVMGEIFWVGVPASLETLLTSAAYVVNNNLAVQYGELTVAGMGIAQKILSLGNYVYQGFASGTQPIMGYNFGSKNYKRMLQVLKAGVMVVSGTELFIMALYGFLAPVLIGIFTETPETIAIGARVLRTFMFILPFVGAVSMCRMSFQAMGKPQFAFGITLVRQLILYVPLLLVLDRCFGFHGMIWAQPITEVIMMAASISLLAGTIHNLERKTL